MRYVLIALLLIGCSAPPPPQTPIEQYIEAMYQADGEFRHLRVSDLIEIGEQTCDTLKHTPRDATLRIALKVGFTPNQAEALVGNSILYLCPIRAV